MRYCIMIMCMLLTCGAYAQTDATADSLTNLQDSLVKALQNQVQELQLQSIMMQEQLELTGRSSQQDSLLKAERKARVDSLRLITDGAPIVVDHDTLFYIYARKGGMMPEQRAHMVANEVTSLGKRITMFIDSIYTFDSEYTTDVMAGSNVIMSVTDIDALWQNTTRQELAEQYKGIIHDKVVELHNEYGLKQKLKGVLLVAIIIVVQVLLIWFTNWLYRRWRLRLVKVLLSTTRPLSIKNYEILPPHRQGLVFLALFRILRLAIIITQLLISIPLLFSVFPETKSLTYTLFGYIWNPLRDILTSIISFVPNLFKIVIIIICFRYLVKALRYLTGEIASGRLKISGFYTDWAQPTFYIIRLLCYSFMLVMIWPLLPGSDSQVFQGVSVFIGLIISLGSSSIIGNIIAGMVMTYMRPFRIGDFIRYGDTEGFVIEKTVLVTRIRTRKNEVITIPNSNLMSSQTSNFSFAAKNYGVIVHTKVTIGYDMKWADIRALLIEAADKTPGLQKKPEPYVRITALDDFYVEYEINAFTRKADALSDIYSALHQNILDSFHTAGVEIMSPHIFAHRQNLDLQIPEVDRKG
ncbi:MAG: mechanosensitive ion channel [Bacteroidaceae bacterium]|nr:mechanosensitive ion channel [Bacteroidaceae bacterium]